MKGCIPLLLHISYNSVNKDDVWSTESEACMDQKIRKFYAQLQCCCHNEDFDSLEQLLRDSEQMLAQEPEHIRQLIAAYETLGTLYRGTHHFSRSLIAFQKACALLCDHFGTNCMEYAVTLSNLASTYRLANQHTVAIKLFRDVLRLYHQMGLEADYSYVNVLNNIALVYQESGQTDFAIYYLEKALKLIRSMPQCRPELTITYSNLTALHYKAGRESKAKECLEQALQVYDACKHEEHPQCPAALNSLAGILYSAKEHERALSVYQMAAEYTKRFYGETEEFAHTQQNMSWIYKERRDLHAAAEALSISARIYQTLFGPNDERTCVAREQLARVRGEIERGRT